MVFAYYLHTSSHVLSAADLKVSESIFTGRLDPLQEWESELISFPVFPSLGTAMISWNFIKQA
jgi:hypothetical protein